MCYTETTAIISFIIYMVAGIYLIVDFSFLRNILAPTVESENDNRMIGFLFIILSLGRVYEWIIFSREPEDCSTNGSRLGFLILIAAQPAFVVLIAQRYSKRFKIDDTSIRFSDLILTMWILAYSILLIVIATTKLKDIHHMHKNLEVSPWCVTEEICTEHLCHWQMDWDPIDRKLYPLWWTVTFLTLTLSLDNWVFWTTFALILPLVVWVDKEHFLGSIYSCVWVPGLAFLLAALGVPSWLASQFTDAFEQKRQKRHLVAIPLY